MADTTMQDNPTMTPDPQPAAPAAAAAAPAAAAPAQDQSSDGAVSTTAPSGGGATSPAAPSGAGAPAAAGASSTPAAAAPTAPAPTPEAQYQNPGTNPFSRTYFTALRALGGADTAHVQRDPQTGQITGVTVANSSPGDQFKRVLAAFASGVAATPGPGPGGATRSIAAGAGAGIKYQQDRQQQQTDDSNAAFDNQQKALVTKAQTQLLNQKTAEATWEFARKKVDAAFLDNTRLDTFDKFVRDNGGEQLGTVASWGDLADLRAKDPNIYQDHANGQIVGVPAIENGKVVGMNIARVPPDWGSQRIATDMPLPQIGADGKTTTATVPAGSMSNADYATRYQASLQPILAKQAADQKEKDENTRAAGVQAGENRRAAGVQAGENARLDKTLDSKESIAANKATAPNRADVATHDKMYVKPANDTEQSYQMMDKAYDEYKAAAAQGKQLPTGAQSMLALSTHLSTTFGNVKGARVTKDMIQEHLGARGVTDSAKVAVQKLTNGDALSPAQWDAFHDLVGQSRQIKWETAVKEAKRKDVPINFLPSDLESLAVPSDAAGVAKDASGTIVGYTDKTGKYNALGK